MIGRSARFGLPPDHTGRCLEQEATVSSVRQAWTDDDLRRAAAGSRTLREVAGKLGLEMNGGIHRTLHKRAREAGITLPNKGPGPLRSWTNDDLRRAIATSTSIAEVTRKLGLVQGGRTNRLLQAHAEQLGLSLPNVWRRGEQAKVEAATDVLARHAAERLLPRWRSAS